VNAATTNYTLDLNAGLTQVLSDGSNTYLYGAMRIGELQAGGMAYHLGDALGSVRQLTDATGAVTLARNFEPYGKVLNGTGSGSTTFAFTGEQLDAATGFTFLRARFYNSGYGRFFQRDTFAGDPTAPLSLNRYLYAHANPLTYTDPSGHCILGVDCIIVGGVFLATALVLAACNNAPTTAPIVSTTVPTGTSTTGPTATPYPYIVAGLNVRFESASQFSVQEQRWIQQVLSNWGNLIGATRFAQYVQQSASIVGKSEYLIRYNPAATGAGHLDREALVQFPPNVFATDNWKGRFRPDPAYQNQAASARISVAHEFGHVILNADPSPLVAFDNAFDEKNQLHTTVGPSADEGLVNILAFMTEQGTGAPGIPTDLKTCVVNNILPYLDGTNSTLTACALAPTHTPIPTLTPTYTPVPTQTIVPSLVPN
jgi:RHS repeat-associated protein